MYLIIILFILTLIILEISHLTTKNSILQMDVEDLIIEKSLSSIKVKCLITFYNPNNRKEIMIPELKISCNILGNDNYSPLKISQSISPVNESIQKRFDNYWQSYIIKSLEETKINLNLKVEGQNTSNSLKDIDCIWINVSWVNYSPFGRKKCKKGFVVPINRPTKFDVNNNSENTDIFKVIPIKTHKLGIIDDPYKLFDSYISNVHMPGDIITIGETPLAIMQGRYHHPSMLQPNLLAKLLCYYFHPTSSLATACGMQSLIDEVGPSRVIFSWLVASILKLIKVKGIFYRLAGDQARLIDDITGTTPPYDQVIVLGPINTKQYCEQLAEKHNINFAVVDVNDLGKVKIIASSKNTNKTLLKRALSTNPAGNADEQTPIVIVRPS